MSVSCHSLIFLNHFDVSQKEQFSRMKRVLVQDLISPLVETLRCITLENLNLILKDLDLTCCQFTRLVNGDGVINLIYFLTTKRHDGTSFTFSLLTLIDSEGPELVLRISNCHPWWKQFKLESEVAVMKFVKKTFPHIPVPKIIKYNSNSETSEVRAEYVVMEKMPGVPLSRIVCSCE